MAKVTVFKNEKDVRKWVKKVASDPTWVEPTSGGSTGTPDVFATESRGVWVELKHGKLITLPTGASILRWEMRWKQVETIARFRASGVRVGLLVGFESRVFFTTDPEIIAREWAPVGTSNTVEADVQKAWPYVMKKLSEWSENPVKISPERLRHFKKTPIGDHVKYCYE